MIPRRLETRHQVEEFKKRLPEDWKVEILREDARQVLPGAGNVFFEGRIQHGKEKHPFKVTVAELVPKGPLLALVSFMNTEKGQRMLESVEKIYGEPVMKEITMDALGKEFVQATYVQTSHAPRWKERHDEVVESCLDGARAKPTHLAELPVASWGGKLHPPSYRIPDRLDLEHQLRTFAERAKLVFSEGKLTVDESRQPRPDVVGFSGNVTVGRFRTPFKVTINNMLFGPKMAVMSFHNDELGEAALEKLSQVYGAPAAKTISRDVMTDRGKTEFIDLYYFEPHEQEFVEKVKRDLKRLPTVKKLF